MSEKLFIPGGAVVLPPMVPADLAVEAGSVRSRNLSVSWSLPASTRPVPAYYRLSLQGFACADGPESCPTSAAPTITEHVNVRVPDPNCTHGCTATIAPNMGGSDWAGLRPSHKYTLAISAMSYVVGSNVSLPTSEGSVPLREVK